ncbi:helix-turn-helix transcriptional regulator [Acetobacter sp. TBRC 12305]|uniref:Helix-turn-helix transcriptional regulator n=1 Tax=Acetobacter garciniae TaxID=2817435 RepID=A0A939HPT2_9PROT|nr:helix-turn-helix transcriptional regulator [Acetobacter garciniae]MBO1325096.1 helix-turn-helix transcriptional regulator [Acetobacter garciniae]MBX0344933.1 helix-turn-helix transcriptional regulator [Acetobacter garciniae]
MLKLNALIEGIYNCAVDESTWSATLKECSKLLGISATVIVPTNPKEQELSISSLDTNWHVAMFHDYFHTADPYCRLDPYNEFFENKINVVGDFCDADFVSDAEVARSTFYQEFLKKYEWGRTNVFIHQDPFSVAVKISTQRHFGKRNETEEERQIRNILSRHICRSLTLSVGNRQASLIEDGFAGLCQNLTCGAALLRNDTKVLMMNDKFKSLIGDAFTYTDGRLSFANRHNTSSLHSLITSVLLADSEMPDDGIICVNCTTNTKTLLKILKLPHIGSRGSSINRQSAVLLLTNRPGDTPADVSNALRIWGLTQSEVRLARYIGAGTPPKIAAEFIGISEQYARTLLKEIFRKLNVNSQSQLATFMGTLSPMGTRSNRPLPANRTIAASP